jgi:hypothetical protein
MRAWPQLLCLLLVLPTLAGCGKAPAESAAPRAAKARQGPPQTLPAAKPIYTAGGSVGAGWFGAVAVQPGGGQRSLVLVEWVASKKDPSSGSYRLLRFDLVSRKLQRLADLGEGELDSGAVACAANGRIAMREERRWGYDEDCRIKEREPDGQWRAVTDWTNDLETPEGWSPDSSALLMRRLRQQEGWPLVYAVASSSGPRAPFTEMPLSPRPLQQAVWSADSSRLFASALRSGPGLTVDLVSIAWPSRKAQSLLTTSMAELMVAEESGTLVACAMGADQQYQVWRVDPGAAPVLTPASPPSVPVAAAVSPDGEALAVVLGQWTRQDRPATSEGGLAVFDLATGAERLVPDTVGKNINVAHWVLGGHALIFTIAPKGLDDYDAKGMGRQVWLVEVEPVPHPAPGRRPGP